MGRAKAATSEYLQGSEYPLFERVLFLCFLSSLFYYNSELLVCICMFSSVFGLVFLSFCLFFLWFLSRFLSLSLYLAYSFRFYSCILSHTFARFRLALFQMYGRDSFIRACIYGQTIKAIDSASCRMILAREREHRAKRRRW